MFKTLGTILELMREQNSLLRELIQVLTHRPALTRPTGQQATPPRKFTADDVFVQTREQIAAQQETSRRMASAPWQAPPVSGEEPKSSESTTNSKSEKP